jgi:hypothetical protein
MISSFFVSLPPFSLFLFHGRRLWVLVLGFGVLTVLGCQQQMAEQPRYDPLEPSTFFADGQSARQLVPNTVARGQLRDDAHLHTGRTATSFAETFPFAITHPVLERGQERYNIFCSPCHDRVGNGDGMIVRRGYTRPPAFSVERLRSAPPGHFFTVITHGLGAMPGYAAQIPASDRWAITAYIRALQLSQHATLAEVPVTEREKLTR